MTEKKSLFQRIKEKLTGKEVTFFSYENAYYDLLKKLEDANDELKKTNREIGEREGVIKELRNQIERLEKLGRTEKPKEQPAGPDDSEKKTIPLENFLNNKELKLVKILQTITPKNYGQITEEFGFNKEDPKDVAKIRLLMSRMKKKLEKHSALSIQKVEKQDGGYFRI